MEEMLSLFDYLGHAAGTELGRRVAMFAKKKKSPHSIRFVTNVKYTGEVMLYEKALLDNYFKGIKV
jgi:hypothetical protein